MGLYTDTSRLKWIFWTSHHLVLLIDMLLKLSRNLSTRTNGNLGLQIHNNQSMTKTALTNCLPKTSPRHRKRRVTGRQRRTLYFYSPCTFLSLIETMYYCISMFMVASLIHFYYIIEYLRYLRAFLYYISDLISCRK
jgi:hypothetical protein